MYLIYKIRFHALQLTHTDTVGRMAQKEVRLKSGAILAPGTPLGVLLWPLTHDPEFWEEPDMFDPWRHEKLGQQQGNHIDNLMTAVR